MGVAFDGLKLSFGWWVGPPKIYPKIDPRIRLKDCQKISAPTKRSGLFFWWILRSTKLQIISGGFRQVSEDDLISGGDEEVMPI